jgi:hypothetical protein
VKGPAIAVGPVYSTVVAEGDGMHLPVYSRIPWYSGQPPIASVPATCIECNSAVEQGIHVATATGELGFCCAAHYLNWWKRQHPTEELLPVPSD